MGRQLIVPIFLTILVTLGTGMTNLRFTNGNGSSVIAESLPPIDWNHYHNYTEVESILLSLNETYPDTVDVFSIGTSWQDRTIYCVRLTNESDGSTKPEVLFVAYHHAREVITSELALYFVVYAATNYGVNYTVTELLNGCQVYVVVGLNVDGYDLFQSNDMQRKNARPTDEDYDGRIDEEPLEDEDGDGIYGEQLFNVTDVQFPEFIREEGIDNDGDGKNGEDWIGGVDLNRNYDFHWKGGGGHGRGSELYEGPTAFSEPETQAIRNLAFQHNFAYGIDFHSGDELILYPWMYTSMPAPDEAKFIEISEGLSALTGGTTYEQASDLYLAYGTWQDWMYGNKSVIAFSCEIFANYTWAGIDSPGPFPNTTWSGAMYKYGFNPFPSAIQSTIMRWLPAFFYLSGRAIADQAEKNIAVRNVEADKGIVCAGYGVKINASVWNTGTSAEAFNVSIYVNSSEIFRQELTLQNGSSSYVTAIWNCTGYSLYLGYAVKAYAWPIDGDELLADNTFDGGTIVVSVKGDVNADRKINILDITKIAISFGSRPGNVNWNSVADINGDEIVNILDITIIAVHFGETSP